MPHNVCYGSISNHFNIQLFKRLFETFEIKHWSYLSVSVQQTVYHIKQKLNL